MFYSPALLQNAGVFRELGGASLAGKLVHHADTRDAGLGLLQQLVVAGGIHPCLHFDCFFLHSSPRGVRFAIVTVFLQT